MTVPPRPVIRFRTESIASLSCVPQHPGALVISLDFELHWGMRDHTAPGPQTAEALIASRSLVTTLADLFVQREIRATWATVGLLFATTAREADSFSPTLRPAYRLAELDPYAEPVGQDEEDDPLHLAGSLVEQLARAPGQEIGSHTFSHYYCLEEGPDEEAFRADLAAARAVAASRGLRLRSLVLPRNQWRDELAPVLLDTGFECYRGPQPGWANRARRGADSGLAVRTARFATTYAGPTFSTSGWDDLMEPSGLCNLRASAFLRPVSPKTRPLGRLQERRIIAALRDAARRGRIVHLWWHPQNFVSYPDENLARLHRILDETDRLRTSDGMRSLNMGDVNDTIRTRPTSLEATEASNPSVPPGDRCRNINLPGRRKAWPRSGLPDRPSGSTCRTRQRLARCSDRCRS